MVERDMHEVRVLVAALLPSLILIFFVGLWWIHSYLQQTPKQRSCWYPITRLLGWESPHQQLFSPRRPPHITRPRPRPQLPPCPLPLPTPAPISLHEQQARDLQATLRLLKFEVVELNGSQQWHAIFPNVVLDDRSCRLLFRDWHDTRGMSDSATAPPRVSKYSGASPPQVMSYSNNETTMGVPPAVDMPVCRGLLHESGTCRLHEADRPKLVQLQSLMGFLYVAATRLQKRGVLPLSNRRRAQSSSEAESAALSLCMPHLLLEGRVAPLEDAKETELAVVSYCRAAELRRRLVQAVMAAQGEEQPEMAKTTATGTAMHVRCLHATRRMHCVGLWERTRQSTGRAAEVSSGIFNSGSSGSSGTSSGSVSSGGDVVHTTMRFLHPAEASTWCHRDQQQWRQMLEAGEDKDKDKDTASVTDSSSLTSSSPPFSPSSAAPAPGSALHRLLSSSWMMGREGEERDGGGGSRVLAESSGSSGSNGSNVSNGSNGSSARPRSGSGSHSTRRLRQQYGRESRRRLRSPPNFHPQPKPPSFDTTTTALSLRDYAPATDPSLAQSAMLQGTAPLTSPSSSPYTQQQPSLPPVIARLPAPLLMQHAQQHMAKGVVRHDQLVDALMGVSRGQTHASPSPTAWKRPATRPWLDDR